MNYLSPSSLSTSHLYRLTPKPFPLNPTFNLGISRVLNSNEGMKTQTSSKKISLSASAKRFLPIAKSKSAQPKNDCNFFKTQNTYNTENLHIADKRTLTSDMEKYITISSIDPALAPLFEATGEVDPIPGRSSVYCYLNEAGKEKFGKNDFFFCFYQEGNQLFSLTNVRSRDIPWKAADIFEFAFNKALESGRIHNDIKGVTLCGISSGSNKNLSNNLEKIRADNSIPAEEKTIRLEMELFTGDHSGKSLLRKLNRIGLCPKVNSLTADLSKQIMEGDSLSFSVEKKSPSN